MTFANLQISTHEDDFIELPDNSDSDSDKGDQPVDAQLHKDAMEEKEDESEAGVDEYSDADHGNKNDMLQEAGNNGNEEAVSDRMNDMSIKVETETNVCNEANEKVEKQEMEEEDLNLFPDTTIELQHVKGDV